MHTRNIPGFLLPHSLEHTRLIPILSPREDIMLKQVLYVMMLRLFQQSVTTEFQKTGITLRHGIKEMLSQF